MRVAEIVDAEPERPYVALRAQAGRQHGERFVLPIEPRVAAQPGVADIAPGAARLEAPAVRGGRHDNLAMRGKVRDDGQSAITGATRDAGRIDARLLAQ